MNKPDANKFVGHKPLLVTKFFLPYLQESAVSRWDLIKRLSDRLYSGSRLTLVSAPAGYGKTTLITDWMIRTDRKYTWLTLDSDDNDPVRFLSYLVAALQKVYKSIGNDAQDSIGRPVLPPVDSLLTPIINDVALLAKPIIVVLEDYHSIYSEFVHQSVQYLLDHQPPSLHLVLITRFDPPLSLARLRSYNQITELEIKDLVFSFDETADFLLNTAKLNVNNAQIEALQRITEGWITGLRLAARFLRDIDEELLEEGIQEFNGSNSLATEYFVEQVYSKQPAAIKEFLCQTSVLDRICAPLCDEIMNRDDSSTILVNMEKDNLFLMHIGKSRKWYRYHPLFAEFLRTRISEEQKVVLKQGAAKWFEASELISDAINCMSVENDISETVRLIERGAYSLLQQGKLRTLQTWLSRIPHDILLSRAELVPYKSWILFFTGQFEELSNYLGIIDSTAQVKSTELNMGTVLSIRAWLAAIRNENKSLHLAKRALIHIGEDNPFYRIATMIALEHAAKQAGNTEASTSTLQEAFSLGKKMDHPFAALWLLTEIVPDLIEKGQRRKAVTFCQEAIHRCTDSQDESMPCSELAYIPLGSLCYEANELAEAYKYASRGLAYCKEFFADIVLGWRATVTLALVHEAIGEFETALDTVQKARREARRIHFVHAVEVTAAIESEILLRNGQIQPVLSWAKKKCFTSNDRLKPGYELQYLTYARLLLAQERLEDAQNVLIKLEQCTGKMECFGTLLRVLVVRTLTEMALDHEEVALSCLERSLLIAAPEQYQRVFLNEGQAIAGLLSQVQEITPDFVHGLLDTFNREKMKSVTTEAHQPIIIPLHSAEHSSDDIAKPLSEREREVLQLVAEGLSNKAIGDRLFISVGTVKWHINNIFSKLAVRSRTQAIARSRALNLLEK